MAAAVCAAMMVPAAAEEPTLEGCREGIMQWTLESDLIKSIVNTDEGIAITPNQELIDQLPEDAREYVESCLEMVTTASDSRRMGRRAVGARAGRRI